MHRRSAGLEDLLTLHDDDHNRGGVNTGHGHGSQKNSKNPTKSPTKGYATF